MSLADLLSSAAARRPDNIALKLDDVELSYAALDAAAARVAGLLRSMGVEVGDRVGLMVPNVPHFAVLFHGAQRAGAVVVPMNVLLKAREVGFYLQDSGAKVLFAWSGFAQDAEAGAAAAGAECVLIDPAGFVELVASAEPSTELVERTGDDTAVILYTSGTTGTPKGAELTHASLTSNAEVSGELFSVSSTDVIFGGLPLFHVFGLTCGLNTAIAAGATLTLLPRFDPTKALEILERDRVTIFEGVPTMYGALLNHPRRSRVRRCRAARLRVGRRGAAGRGAARFRCRLRLQGPGGLRVVGDLAGRVVQPPRPRAQARLDRHADQGRRDEGVRRRRQRGTAGRGRRDRHPRPQPDERLLAQTGGDGGRHPPAAGSTPATWPESTRTATSSSSTARRT